MSGSESESWTSGSSLGEDAYDSDVSESYRGRKPSLGHPRRKNPGLEETAKLLFNGKPDTRLVDLVSAFKKTKATQWITGVVPVSSDELKVFFNPTESVSRVMNYPYHDMVVQDLERACSKATFGLGTKDVLDETYRKAGKLDFGRFAWLFNTEALSAAIRTNLMPFAKDSDILRFELYKLNVYGKGSFFKAHKDTPRGNDMFASLVLILPSNHTGGQLVLKSDEEVHTFDAAAELVDRPNHVAYAAFYSDVDHEVLEVIEGARITITYNLYWTAHDADALFVTGKEATPEQPVPLPPYHRASTPPPAPRPGMQFHSSPLQRELEQLLTEKDFLPQGGLLGFALQHLYPMPARHIPLRVAPRLKGLDAVLAHTCEVLGLGCAVRVVYYEKDIPVMTSRKIYNFTETVYFHDNVLEVISKRSGTAVTQAECKNPDFPRFKEEDRVHWITSPKSELYDKQYVAAYGNEASMETIYAYFGLIIGIGPAHDRQAHDKIPPLSLAEREERRYAARHFDY